MLAGGEGSRLECEIFEAIAPPGVSYNPRREGDLKKRRNVINDARALRCHITYTVLQAKHSGMYITMWSRHGGTNQRFNIIGRSDDAAAMANSPRASR